jgi:hypothetical protein
MNKSEEWAKWYYEQGFNIIPAKTGEKNPAILTWKHWQENKVDDDTFKAWLKGGWFRNINLCLGQISDIYEIDVDVRDAPVGLILAGYSENEVWVCESSGGKIKIFFRAKSPLPNKVDCKVNNNGEHVELRGDFHLSVLPPSIHPSGSEYIWKTDVKESSLKPVDGRYLYDSIVARLMAHFSYQEKRDKEKDNSDYVHNFNSTSGVRDFFWDSYERGDLWSGSEGHSFRLAFCAELINAGYTDEQIHIFFKKHDEKSGENYSEVITQKKINDLRKKEMHRWRYTTLIAHCGDLIK